MRLGAGSSAGGATWPLFAFCGTGGGRIAPSMALYPGAIQRNQAFMTVQDTPAKSQGPQENVSFCGSNG